MFTNKSQYFVGCDRTLSKSVGGKIPTLNYDSIALGLNEAFIVNDIQKKKLEVLYGKGSAKANGGREDKRQRGF